MSAHEATHVEEAEHGTIKSFTVVWIFLLAFTGIEVLLAYEQVTPVIMLVVLIGLSVVKAALEVGSQQCIRIHSILSRTRRTRGPDRPCDI